MTTSIHVERVLDAFLAPDHDELAGRVIEAALDEIDRTKQRRGWPVPWRFPQVNGFLRPALAAVAVVIALGAVYVIGSPPSSAPVPSPSPTAPVETGAALDRTAHGYTLTVPPHWNSRVVAGGVNFSLPQPLVSATLWESEPVSGTNPEFVIDEGGGSGTQILIRGHTLEELLATTNAIYRSMTSSEPSRSTQTTIDGERAFVVEHVTAGPDQLWADVLVIHNDRAYGLVITSQTGQEATATLRQQLDAFLASIAWAD